MRKKVLIISAAILVLAAIGGGVYYFVIRDDTPKKATVRPTNDVDYSSPDEEQQRQNAQLKKEIIEKNEKAHNPNPSESSNIDVSVIRADQWGKGQPFNLRVVINGTATGECLVELKKDGQPTISKTFPVTFEATSSGCKGADIPVSEFSVAGKWNLTLIVKNNTAQSSPVTRSVDITK